MDSQTTLRFETKRFFEESRFEGYLRMSVLVTDDPIGRAGLARKP